MRGADRRARLHRRRGRAAHQRRRDLPRLPRDDRRGRAHDQPPDLRLLARRHRHGHRVGAVPPREGRRRGQRPARRDRHREDGARRRSRRCATAGVRVARFRPLKPYAIRRANNRTHRKILVADGQRRDDRRRRHRRGVDGQRRGPRPLARHPRAHPRPGRPRAAGRVRRQLARGDRRGPHRRRLPPRAGAGRTAAGRCRSSARRPAWATPTSRRCTSSPWRRRGSASISLPRTSPRGRRSSRRSREAARARRRGARPRPRPAHRQGLRPRRRPRGLRRAARRRRADLRVPADDAPREDADHRRRVVVGRQRQLRQPLVPAARRGDAVRAERALRRPR